jgi:hypothetical protein
VVDAERELLEPLGYGVGRDSERAEGIEVPEGTGGVRERSPPPGRVTSRRGTGEPCTDWARRLPSFVRLRCWPSGRAIGGVFYEASDCESGRYREVKSQRGIDWPRQEHRARDPVKHHDDPRLLGIRSPLFLLYSHKTFRNHFLLTAVYQGWGRAPAKDTLT